MQFLILLLATGPMLQFGALSLKLPATTGIPSKKWPYTINLTREMVPIVRNNRVISHKTSFSGAISLGNPSQEFTVVFDTGSAHVVLPSSSCTNASCVAHQRYNISQSSTAKEINTDGSPVEEDGLCDQVTIGYGTGTVTGEFAREQVCLGPAQDGGPCVEANIVMAVEMTTVPFKSFGFDGIFGLALDSLALTPEFSFFNRLSSTDSSVALQFGVFLAEAESGAQSEITLGGYNSERLLSPLQWVNVASKSTGHWQVKIRSVLVGGKPLDLCKDGSCSGIVDTGTSHLGVPGAHHQDLMRLLSEEVASSSDCRFIKAPTVEIVLEGLTLTLTPENYMRAMALPPDVKFGSMTGEYGAGIGGTNQRPNSGSAVAVPAGSSATKKLSGNDEAWQCAPKLMAVNLPATLGKVFILGDPVLSRYYTVYDWGAKKVGFGYNTREQNVIAMHDEEPEVHDQVFLLQVTLTLTVRKV